jgi:leader peptidase (prepilin peptidase)/N-methyltransferase
MPVMDATATETIVLAIAGALIGSFLNVVAYRLPRGQSVVGGRSHCPGCGVRIAVYDNVPVVSWLVLGGHCRSCHGAISPRYPIVEALTASLFVAVGVQTGSSTELWPGLALMVTLVTVSATDLEYRIVPNKVLAPAALAALALWALADAGRIPENLAAAAGAGGLLLAAALAYPKGMGMGDVKLAAVMGLFLGRSVAPALFTGFLAGSMLGVGMMLVGGAAARKKALPFAPFLAFGGIVGQLFGGDLVHWYAGHFL